MATTPMEENHTPESESSTRQRGIDEQSYQEMLQKFMEFMGRVQIKSNKKPMLQYLKDLQIQPMQRHNKNLLKKCFEIMDCPEAKKFS